MECQRLIAFALVRAMLVVEPCIRLHDEVQMLQVEAGECVEAFPLQRPDPRLAVGVEVRTSRRRLDHLDPGWFQ